MIRLTLVFVVLFSNTLLATEPAEFSLCSDFGCKTRTDASFSRAQWQRIEQLFARPALSPWLEKQQIRRAIALTEYYAGIVNGSNQDLGGNFNGMDLPHQMDCIDESTNTQQYLRALERRGLLQWHKVDGRQQRYTSLIFAHWTAVIKDLSNDRLFAVDSWYEDNGQPPYVQPLESWSSGLEFPASLNPPLGLL